MYLNCHSYFSLRYGTLSPEHLVDHASRLGITHLALTDINNSSAALEFYQRCRKAGIHPVMGVEFRHKHLLRFIGLARTLEGWGQLNAYLTHCSLEEEDMPVMPPPNTFDEQVWIIYPSLVKPITHFQTWEKLGVRPESLHQLYGSSLLRHMDKLVAWCPATFMDSDGFRLHKLLRCIDLNILGSRLTAQDHAHSNELLHAPEALHNLYRLYPQLLAQAQSMLEVCDVMFTTGLSLNRQTFSGSIEGDYKLLEKLALEGCRRRYGSRHIDAFQRVHKELKIILQQRFCAYFLITWDIVRYAQAAGYHHVGRGSGANSIVAFCLGITDVDPLELDLYFERFINPYRASPPDFDIDFSWAERDDVTDYIFKRYGKEHTALMATYNTFKGSSIVRELGKVLGLPKGELDNIVDHPHQPEKHHELAKVIFKYGKLMAGFPNYLSIHAGGILISEAPLRYVTALQMMPKGFPIVQIDMYHAEDWGLHKYDILSQRGIGHIKDSVDFIRSNRGIVVDIHDIARIKNDPKVKALLKKGDCMGCFYIESPAMRGLLHKLQCDNYVHLVAASSIIRPGVAKSGMMREYIHRFHHPDQVVYLHPVFKEHLGETFGVMVYQEDVMKIVHHFAGLELDESDVLRRIMSGKKFKGDTFEVLRRKYFDNCKARGHSDELAEEVWRQVESFSGYSFCKAHSASFAVESFQSLYLKAHYPIEFMVAVINNFGGFYSTEFYVHEARMSGAIIHAPCINRSQFLTTVDGIDVFIGWIHIQGFERSMGHKIVTERAQNGLFRDMEDFMQRVDVHREQLDLLIRIGAFRFSQKNKYTLMWSSKKR